MKSLADKAVALGCILAEIGWAFAAIYAVTREAIREHNLKRRLGRFYEGPAA